MTGPAGLDDLTVAELHTAMTAGTLTSVALVQHCLDRIAAHDGLVHAVIALVPDALEQAAAADARIAAGTLRPLEGIPVLVKDNVAVGGLPTTAGSRALVASCPPDAPLVTRLRDAGAIVLGKANLSEWANFRSTHSSSGWSAVGGQTRNPHVLDRSTSGSSSGSAVAVAAGFVPLAIGTETDGSIVSPAGICGVVGFKPSLGAVPGAGIVPISAAQDGAGPMTRHVADAALLFAVIAGRAVPAVTDPSAAATALAGRRLGVWRPLAADATTLSVLDTAVAALGAAGAVLVDVDIDPAPIEKDEWPALVAEFREQLDAYLATAPDASVRSLAELVEFNRADDVELTAFGQEILETALTAPPTSDPTYQEQRSRARALARAMLDGPLAEHRLDAVVTLSNNPAWAIDHVKGDAFSVSTSTPAAVAGYPSLSVPGGLIDDLPVGISLIGAAGTDEDLLAIGHGLEAVTRARAVPRFLPTR